MREKFRNVVSFLIGFLLSMILLAALHADAKTKVYLDFDRVDEYSFMDWKMRISDEVEEWVDKETGVHYLVIFDDSTIRCMSPRYDSNGKVMVKK